MRKATLPVRPSNDVIIVAGKTQIPPIGSSSVSSILRPNNTPPSLAAVNILSFFQPLPVINTSNTVSSVTVPVVNQQPLFMFLQVQPSVTLTTTMTEVNLSAWTLSSLPTVHARIPDPVR